LLDRRHSRVDTGDKLIARSFPDNACHWKFDGFVSTVDFRAYRVSRLISLDLILGDFALIEVICDPA
jgi:hypothetical protein